MLLSMLIFSLLMNHLQFRFIFLCTNVIFGRALIPEYFLTTKFRVGVENSTWRTSKKLCRSEKIRKIGWRELYVFFTLKIYEQLSCLSMNKVSIITTVRYFRLSMGIMVSSTLENAENSRRPFRISLKSLPREH